MNWEKGGSYNPLDAENLSQDHDQHHQCSEGCIPTPHEYHNYPQDPHQTSPPLPDTFEGLGAPPSPVDTHFSSTGASSTQQQLEEGSHSIHPYHQQQHNSSKNHYNNRHHRRDRQIASNIDSYNDNQHNTSSGGTCASITSSSSRNHYCSPRKGVGQNNDIFGGANLISSSSPATISLNEKRQYHHHVSKEVRRGRPAQQEHSRQNTSTHQNSAMHIFPRHNYDQNNSTHNDAYIGVTHNALVHNSHSAFVRSNAGVTTPPVHPHHHNCGVPRIDPHSNSQHAHAYAVASSHPANFYNPYISAQHPATGAHGVSRDDNPIETIPQHLFSNQHLNNMEENSTTVAARPPHLPNKSIILTHPQQQKNNSRWNFLLMTRILLRTLKLQEEHQQQREYQSKDQDKEQYFHQHHQYYEHAHQENMRQQLEETRRLYHQAKSIIQDCCSASFDDSRTILTAKNTTTSTEITTSVTSTTANTGTTTRIHGTNDGDRPEQPFSFFNGDAMTDSGDGRTNSGIKPNIICSSNINFDDTRVDDGWTNPIRTTKPGDYEQQNTQQRRHDETHAPSMTPLPSWANATYKRLREVEGIIPYLDNAEESVKRYWARKKARNDAAAVPEKSDCENRLRNIRNSSGIMSPLSFTSSSLGEEEEDIRISPIRVRTASPPP